MRYFVVEVPDSPEDRKTKGVSYTSDPLSDFATFCVANGLHYKEVQPDIVDSEVYKKFIY